MCIVSYKRQDYTLNKIHCSECPSFTWRSHSPGLWKTSWAIELDWWAPVQAGPRVSHRRVENKARELTIVPGWAHQSLLFSAPCWLDEPPCFDFLLCLGLKHRYFFLAWKGIPSLPLPDCPLHLTLWVQPPVRHAFWDSRGASFSQYSPDFPVSPVPQDWALSFSWQTRDSLKVPKYVPHEASSEP